MTLGLGVAGAGWLGESLIQDALRADGLSVVAVQDVVAGRARAVAERYRIAWSGEDFEDLLHVPGVDAIVICTPNALHPPQAQAALAAGRHVLVQKPLALTSDAAQATLAAAERAGRVLFVDYTYRFLETMAVLRQRVSAGSRIRGIRAVFHNIYGPGAEKRWFFEPNLSGGGALTDLGVHLLDLSLWLLAPDQVRLESISMSSDGPVERAADLGLEADGVPVHIAVSWNAPLPTTEISLEVHLQTAMLRWENVDGSFFHFRTAVDGEVVADRETTLREDTLREFRHAVKRGTSPVVDTRVYALLDQAYGRVPMPGR